MTCEHSNAELREALHALYVSNDMIALKRRCPEMYVKINRYSFLTGYPMLTARERTERASLKIELESLGFYPGWSWES